MIRCVCQRFCFTCAEDVAAFKLNGFQCFVEFGPSDLRQHSFKFQVYRREKIFVTPDVNVAKRYPTRDLRNVCNNVVNLNIKFWESFLLSMTICF